MITVNWDQVESRIAIKLQSLEWQEKGLKHETKSMVSWKNDLVNENGFQRNIPQICVIFVFTNVRIRVFEFFSFPKKGWSLQRNCVFQPWQLIPVVVDRWFSGLVNRSPPRNRGPPSESKSWRRFYLGMPMVHNLRHSLGVQMPPNWLMSLISCSYFHFSLFFFLCGQNPATM